MEWDVKITDPIEYFDTNLSYELTKYIPINKTSGLDFNPDWFREDAIHKMNTGKYSDTVFGTQSYRDFWSERNRRCVEGYESNGYRISGDNYFWLNFHRLKGSRNEKSRGRKIEFPMFLVFQYEYFHYVEICELLGYDIGLIKSRGVGLSEIGAELAVRPYTTTPNYRTLVTAPSERHLSPILSKIWAQLNWLNEETEKGFKHLRMAIDTNTYKRASKKTKDGSEKGHMSEIEGVIADSAEKIRGDRTERLLFEEAGSDPNLKSKYIQGEALIKVLGGSRVGTRIVWGTGGDTGPQLAGLKDIVTDPEAYNILKYRHNYTKDGSYTFSAFFIPATKIVFELLDNRGWCDPDLAKAHYEKERKVLEHKPKDLMIYKAEYCFTLDEAFSLEGDNFFPQEQLANQMTNIEVHKNTKKPSVGYLVWKRNEKDEIIGVEWVEDAKFGKISIIEHPIKTEDGEYYDNLYVGGIDSIDIGLEDSASGSGGSKFCIVIKKRIFGLKDPMYVAMYNDRPKYLKEAYDTAAKLLVYYGCKAVLESTRTAILTYFRDNKLIHLLMKRPRSTMTDVVKGNSNMYGAPATVKTITHYRELLYDFILDYSHTMHFRDMVDQLLRYSDAKKKEFDIVAAMGMAELGDEELAVLKPKERIKKNKEFHHVGWWTDFRGYKHYGIIPTNDYERNLQERPGEQDSWLYKDSIWSNF